MKRKNDFCEGWMFHKGELPNPPVKINSKTGTCGGASNLTEEEGFIYRLHPYMAEKMHVKNGNNLYNVAKSLEGDWRQVTLPHDWTAEENPQPPARWEKPEQAVEAGYLLPGCGYYRKRFRIPKESMGKRIIVEFEGVMRNCTIWVNGCYIASHLSGYTGFACDITEYLFYGEEGENVILVKADTQLREGWWAEGGGIYRPVWLYEVNDVHVKRNGVFVRSKINGERAEIQVHTEIENSGIKSAEVTVRTSILSPDGQETAKAESRIETELLGVTEDDAILEVGEIRRWDLDTPVLYNVCTQIFYGEECIDSVTTPFGIREVFYTEEGLRLNGRIVEIKGVCAHQDFAGVGTALTPDLIRYRLEQIKSMGANAYRSAHHPADQILLQLCDEMGILVLNENRRFEMTKESREDLRELIEGSRNHPCIFMWSLENEELMSTLPNGKRLLKAMVQYVHKLDPTRQCTVAGHFACRDEEYVKIPDVAGFNYDMDDAGAMKERVPGLLTIASEDGSYVSARGVYVDEPGKGLCDSYDSGSYMIKMMMKQMGMTELPVGTLGGASSPNDLVYSWNHYKEKAPFLGGMFVWSAFDYRGETFPWNWPAVTSSYGAMDICGFEKDSYYYWKSLWTDQPMVHLLPHWNWEAGTEVQVDVYSNCEEIELFLNGKSLGKKSHKRGRISSWNVGYRPGLLEAKGYREGKVQAEDRQETSGEAEQLYVKKIYEGKKQNLYRIEVKDKEGRICRTSSAAVAMHIENGKITGTGNGNPAGNENTNRRSCETFQGMALVIVEKQEKEPALYVELTKTLAGKEQNETIS